MTLVQTLLVLLLIPVGIYALFALLTLWPRLTRARYRAGQKWAFAPVFWVANPDSVSFNASSLALSDDSEQGEQPSTAKGGARGNW